MQSESHFKIKPFLNLYHYLLPYWKKEVLIFAFSIIGFALGLVNPYLTKLVIDKAYVQRDLGLFVYLVVLGAMVFIISSIITSLANYLSQYVKIRVNFDLQQRIFKKLQFLPYRFFQDTSTGQHLYRINYDIERSSALITDVLPQIIQIIPKALFIFGVLLYLNWKMAVISIALAPFILGTSYLFASRLKKALKIWIEDAQGLFEKAQETLSHIYLIKSFGRAGYAAKEYISRVVQNIRIRLNNVKLEIRASLINGFVYRLAFAIVAFYGGYQVIKGRLTLGSLMAVTLYLGQLSSLQSTFTNFLQQIFLGSVSIERLGVILDTTREYQGSLQAKPLIFSTGNIKFNNVSFGFLANRLVLDNLSLQIPGGSCIGLAGPSGCGKTTLVNLLLRVYQPISGSIIVDGCDIRQIESRSFYEQIGVVLQEPWLWNDTIGNNIRYAKPNAPSQEIQTAARLACIDDFIMGLADGYNSRIGENACKISEGQKQRLAIARALIKRPKILILDEAFSFVNEDLEARIIDNIRRALKASTVILIAHRISAISKTDMVYFFMGPHNIEIAPHEKLLKDTPSYRNFFTYQPLISS